MCDFGFNLYKTDSPFYSSGFKFKDYFSSDIDDSSFKPSSNTSSLLNSSSSSSSSFSFSRISNGWSSISSRLTHFFNPLYERTQNFVEPVHERISHFNNPLYGRFSSYFTNPIYEELDCNSVHDYERIRDSLSNLSDQSSTDIDSGDSDNCSANAVRGSSCCSDFSDDDYVTLADVIPSDSDSDSNYDSVSDPYECLWLATDTVPRDDDGNSIYGMLEQFNLVDDCDNK